MPFNGGNIPHPRIAEIFLRWLKSAKEVLPAKNDWIKSQSIVPVAKKSQTIDVMVASSMGTLLYRLTDWISAPEVRRIFSEKT